MNLESLRQECTSVPNYFNFCKIIRSLEKAKILEGYRHPFNRKKYVYLSPFGEGQLSLTENPSSVSKETLIHDIKVSEIGKSFVDQGWMNNVQLEHELHNKRNFRVTYKIIPDALLEGAKNGVSYKVALEVELSRKSNQRIVEKARQYVASTFYNYVLYIFSKRNYMEKYIEIIRSSVSSEEFNRFLFFIDETMSANPTDLIEMEGFFKGKTVKLSEVFEPVK
ncbi:MAG: hypothetical protein COV37_07710 [Bdellovibrio sp. CG11_big_fil_rev_8_21_14_0_20_39_38]|nr:MAG: hypothetical protein COW78_02740 [Bdellovibrio sp. CG22_combo_CG10-13_8_21_14_all_39_27]PIR35609.1 MAG: hypothetical protein COV37_07710 [Bdellovibrio sp. CG11_big_fil_rev_8_21_14_0_20_39_38]